MQNIIGFHYTLKDKNGEIMDSSRGRPPMLILTGAQQIVPGLEKEIIGMKKGDTKTVIVAAKDAYGPVQEQLMMTVQRSQFPPEADLSVGVQFRVNNDDQQGIFTIAKIDGDNIHIDGNHPMAGKELHFDIEITEKRMPSPDELAHGHAHGPGGAHH